MATRVRNFPGRAAGSDKMGTFASSVNLRQRRSSGILHHQFPADALAGSVAGEAEQILFLVAVQGIDRVMQPAFRILLGVGRQWIVDAYRPTFFLERGSEPRWGTATAFGRIWSRPTTGFMGSSRTCSRTWTIRSPLTVWFSASKDDSSFSWIGFWDFPPRDPRSSDCWSLFSFWFSDC
jgi:hypothetical protein